MCLNCSTAVSEIFQEWIVQLFVQVDFWYVLGISKMLGREVTPITREQATCKECKRLMWEIRLAEKGHLGRSVTSTSVKAANYEKVYEIHLFSAHGLKR